MALLALPETRTADTMKYQGFIGSAYQSLLKRANAELCVNLFPELLEAANPKAGLGLIGTPGYALFADLGQGPVRGLWAEDGRMFAVGGDDLFEIYAGGTFTNRGAVTMAQTPVVLVGNGQQGHQLLVISNGRGFIFDLVTNTLVQITDPSFPSAVHQAGFVDGYFVVLVAGTGKFQLSSLFNGVEWDGLDAAVRSTASDNLLSLVTDHREVWLFGSESMEIWVDSGDAGFPLQPYQGTVMDVGLVGVHTPAQLRAENAIAFLGKDDGGPGVFVVGQGYTPTRVSTHAINRALQGYSTLTNARGYAYQEDGHTYYVLHCPAGETAWVYDHTESQKARQPLWHERRRWNSAQGIFEAPTPWCHVYAFGKHLVGSREDGKIYEQSLTTYTEAGATIRRVRRAPYLNTEHRQQFHHRFELVAETGVGLVGTGAGSDPQVTLESSDDGAETFFRHGNQSLGKLGEHDLQTEWYRLGSTPTDRVYQVVIAEPVAVRLVDAYVDVTVGAH